MKKEEQFLLWFEQLERKDVDIVGGKSSSLGEMTAKTDVPVPYGFATTAYAYRYFIKESGLEEKMRSILSELTDVENSALLRDVSARLRDAIMAEKMPQDLQDAIGAAYVELGKRVGEENPYVAVRSSATAEDLPDASFAGQQDTYLNVQGAETIIAKVKECYASCFTDRAVYYREKQGFDHIEVALSAVVQMMVFSKTSGVMFTVNVATGDDNNILIEAAFGLGEYVVQGTVTPDNYTISKHDHKIIDRCVNEQDIMLVRKKGGDCEEVQVPEELRKVQTLTDEQILELADVTQSSPAITYPELSSSAIPLRSSVCGLIPTATNNPLTSMPVSLSSIILSRLLLPSTFFTVLLVHMCTFVRSFNFARSEAAPRNSSLLCIIYTLAHISER